MQFGAKPLFENISVKFGNGNRYGLIGANGCGKSTFMKILDGSLVPRQQKRGIWDSFGYAWTLMTKKFWAAVGSVGLFYLMAYVVQNIITLIPYLFFMGSLFTTTQEANPNPEEIGASFVIMMLVVFFISFIVGTILNNITQLNQGIVFYSLKEDNENINTKSVIDQIGTSE